MLNFDDRRTWWPGLAAALEDSVGETVRAKVAAASHECYEDALDLLLRCSDQRAVVDAAIDWIRSTTIAAYHGSRLTEIEVQSVRAFGLKPLVHTSRKARLERALSTHAGWSDARGVLDQLLFEHGPGEGAGSREGQVHLTLSRRGLVEDFNPYLTHGSEFDRHVTHALLGDEGVELLRLRGQARVIVLEVPGSVALAAANPHSSIDDLRRWGEIPNLAREFLRAWSYGLADPDFDYGTLHVDCGFVFSSIVPPAWIVDIDALTI